MSRMHEGKKLPPGWIRCESRKFLGACYFFDTQTGTSRWFPPAADTPRPAPAFIPHSPPSSPPPLDDDEDDETVVPQPPVKRARPGGTSAGGQPAVKVAVIVPYRDSDPTQRRAAHLEEFVPYMDKFLQNLPGVAAYRVYIVEQSTDGRKFNRGKLLNIGFDVAKREGFAAFVFHDVDLLPSEELGKWYSVIPERPVHIARVWKQYSNNPKYFGGVVSFNGEDFEAINGFPNTFWGWGGEDDEMYSRVVEGGLKPQSAEQGEFTDLEGLDLQTKLGLLRKNEHWKCQVKQEALQEHGTTWKRNGLADLDYTILERTLLADSIEKVTVDVKFNDHWTDKITRYQDLPKKA